ncbi:DUF58 domain-containing protein [Halobium palmae]|uniref:DUF58 domain-containing protein n=1 Tax=Halobium palmae TaxID=1776492 RepID=A0ABD5RX62_9EURY
MTPTRRFWSVAALCGFLASYGVILEWPGALVGVAGIGAWLVVAQYRTVNQLTVSDDRLELSVSLSRTRITIDEAIQFTVRGSLSQPSPSQVRITAPLPISATDVPTADRTIRLEPGTTTAETTFEVRIPVAGRFSIPPLRVEYASETGLATASVERGDPPTLTVEPPHPRSLHVGQGGEKIAAAYGEHPTGQSGSGLMPAELRQYVPGDAADRIDWKATARLGEPHVREFETETDRRTVVLCDHRRSMSVGPPGETMLAYAREVGLGFCDSAKRLSDPLGLYTIGDEGITSRHTPSTAPENYRSIRTRLLDLSSEGASLGQSGSRTNTVQLREPHLALQRLTGESTQFATRLRPYLDTTDAYVQRLEGDPLFQTIQTLQHRGAEPTWTVLLTDDTDRNQLREAVSLATDGGDHVLVFLTPRVLFERDALSDLERAYDRYLDFEEFRRDLDRLPRVTAFEVGPGDRLEAILAARQTRRGVT